MDHTSQQGQLPHGPHGVSRGVTGVPVFICFSILKFQGISRCNLFDLVCIELPVEGGRHFCRSALTILLLTAVALCQVVAISRVQWSDKAVPS